MKPLRLVAKSPRIDIIVDMGDGAATVTAGLGGWRTVERIDDIALTDWIGQAPLQQDVPILLDGYPHDSVERELNTLLKLGRDAVGEENVPPVFRMYGPVYFEGKAWVLPENGIELDAASVIRQEDGTLVRQGLTLHCLEYVPADEVKLRGKKRREGIAQHNQPLTYTTRKGDTAAKIAHRLYGDWKRWKDFGPKNGIHDPNRVLPAGRELRL